MNNSVRTSYLVIAIIGIITAIPILGGIVNFFNILTFVLLGFSIFILVKQPKGQAKKTGAILMVIACGLGLIGELVVLGSLGSLATIDASQELSSYEAGQAFGALLGGSLMAMVFSLPAWVIKILAIIFSFKTYGELKD